MRCFCGLPFVCRSEAASERPRGGCSGQNNLKQIGWVCQFTNQRSGCLATTVSLAGWDDDGFFGEQKIRWVPVSCVFLLPFIEQGACNEQSTPPVLGRHRWNLGATDSTLGRSDRRGARHAVSKTLGIGTEPVCNLPLVTSACPVNAPMT